VLSGTCVAVHDRAATWTMNIFTGSPLLLSLMSTVVSLPFFLFMLPAGALADKVDRQKLVCTFNVCLAATTFALAVAWLAPSSQPLPHPGLRVFHRSWVCH
jgi:MFS family permease